MLLIIHFTADAMTHVNETVDLAVLANFTLLSVEWNSSLTDKTSDQYKNLADKVRYQWLPTSFIYVSVIKSGAWWFKEFSVYLEVGKNPNGLFTRNLKMPYSPDPWEVDSTPSLPG